MSFTYMFCRIQNLHISQTGVLSICDAIEFCRIQNLHISQTGANLVSAGIGFVEFKIYISLKH